MIFILLSFLSLSLSLSFSAKEPENESKLLIFLSKELIPLLKKECSWLLSASNEESLFSKFSMGLLSSILTGSSLLLSKLLCCNKNFELFGCLL
jgi:hypothetical protein